MNIETNPKLNKTFDENISPDYLIPILSHIAGQTIIKEKTLIVFDEVQLCERALPSLKYFEMDPPMPAALHDAAMQLYRQYLIVGGIPECVMQFKGGMAENYVNVQLSINGYHTYYWEFERGAEIDFVIQRDGQLIPIEVKSADNTRAKSLRVYMDTYKPAYAIKLSAKNFAFEDNKKVVPLYAAFCI